MAYHDAILKNVQYYFSKFDYLTKIIPGSLFLILFSWYLYLRDDVRLFSTIQISQVNQTIVIPSTVWVFIVIVCLILFLGLSWIIAFAIQSLGESVSIGTGKKLLIYYPTNVFDNDSAWYQFYMKFSKIASDSEKKQFTRFATIKEACGNTYVTITLLLCLILTDLILSSVMDNYLIVLNIQRMISSNVFIFATLILFTFSLRAMHFTHVDRMYEYMKRVLEANESTPPPETIGRLETANMG